MTLIFLKYSNFALLKKYNNCFSSHDLYLMLLWQYTYMYNFMGIISYKIMGFASSMMDPTPTYTQDTAPTLRLIWVFAIQSSF